MKRRLLSAFLAVMMVLTMAPVAFAADGVEPTDGTGSSEAAPAKTPQQQIDGIEGTGTVTLDKDYTEDITIRQGQNITLNLNGKKLTNKTGHTITVEQGATLTINGVGTVDNVTHAKSALVNYGEVVLDNGVTLERSSEKGTLVPYNNGGNSYYTILNDKGATMTINNATVENSGGYSSAIRNGGDSQCDKESHLTINDGNFSGGLNAVKNDEFGILTINGGTFSNSSQYVVMNWHNAIINAGTFSAKESSDAVLQTASYDPVRGVGKLEITGGIFNCTGAQDMIYPDFIDGNGKHYPGTASITGGTFSSDVSAYVAEGYVQNNGTVEQLGATNAVAKVGDTYYKTLSAAVAAAQSGETVKLLANIAEGATIPADKTVTLDLNGKNIKPTTGDAIVNKGNLTIVGSGEVAAQNGGSAAIANFPGATANVNGGTFVSAHWYVIKNLGNMTIDGPVTIKKPDGNTDTSSLVDNGWVNPSDLVAGEQVAAQADKAKLTIKSGKFTGKSGSASCSVIKNDDYATLDISGGNFDSTNNKNTSNATTILNWNVATISGGTFIGQYPLANGAYTNAADKGQFTISGGTFTGLQSLFGYGQGGDGVGKITITDGNFAAPAFGDWGSAYTMEISGGYFTTDPSKYLATYTDAQKKYIAKAVTGDYKFHVELADANDLQVVPVAGATAAPSKDELKNNKDIPSDQVDNIVTAAKAVSAPEISKAAQEVAANISDNSNTLGKQYQDAAKNEVPNQEKIEVRTYLDVEPKAYNKSAYTLDITPKYDVVVVGTKADGTTKAEKVVETNTLNVTKATEVSVQLPTGFVSDTNTKLYVQHKGHEYDAAVTANNGVYTANFTNPHGFSPFTISKTPQTVATIGTDKYTSFADAVSAVPANGTIEITGGTSPYTGTANKTFTVKNSTSADITVNGQTIKKNESYTFKYTHSSGGSSGGSSSGKTTYKVTTSAVNNGGVNASPSSAEKGATITITLSPDKGYKLDKLTVTDGSGKTVSTVKKSDTVYTFTMPASAVKVGVSYVKATETPSKTKFNDVSANDWFASAVDYVTGKGMMNGTADNTFSPKANTTRGMVVTVLYRLENQPSTSAASFTDVASGAYYANAVAWANANGIVSGYGSGKFGPNDKVTREQLAAILYRYAQYKKYDVSVGEDTNILSYNDAQSISTYAIPAIQWACGAGVVTGKSGSKLDPKGNATRAEVAAMLMRFCENVK